MLSANRYGTMVDELRDLVEGALRPHAGADRPVRCVRAVELYGDEREVEEVDLDTLREEADGLASSEEELLLLALFGEEAEPLLRAIRERSSGDESLAASGLDQERAARIREVVRIVQETGIGEITIEENGMRVSVRRTADAPSTSAAAPTVPAASARARPICPRRSATTRCCGSRARWSARSTARPRPARRRSSRRATRSRRARRSASSRR